MNQNLYPDPDPEIFDETQSNISDAQLQANRANAQLSRGPVTPAGKERSSRNALKTGLTGRTALLPEDDPELYRRHIEHLRDELKPIGELESQIVHRLADAQWRLNRIPTLERNLYKLGRFQCAALFENESEEDRAGLIQAHTAVTFQKQFQNLSIQESRVRRGYEKDLDELKSLQSQRGKLENSPELLSKWPAPWPGGCQSPKGTDSVPPNRKRIPKPFGRHDQAVPVLREFPENGFEFSKPEEKPEPIAREIRFINEATGEAICVSRGKTWYEPPPGDAPQPIESSARSFEDEHDDRIGLRHESARVRLDEADRP